MLDEATSSIDTEAEQRIQRAIDRVLEGRTSFIIAHRLSTIRNSDRILVIRGGEMVESGTHDELMQREGYYYHLYTNQFQDEQTQQVLGAKTAEDGRKPCLLYTSSWRIGHIICPR